MEIFFEPRRHEGTEGHEGASFGVGCYVFGQCFFPPLLCAFVPVVRGFHQQRYAYYLAVKKNTKGEKVQ